MQLLVHSEEKKKLVLSALSNLERYMDKTDKKCGLSEDEISILAELESADIIVRSKLRPNERPGRFSPGDRVIHLIEGPGTVEKNESNEYAEVYKVKYDKGFYVTSSEGLLTFETKPTVKQ